MANHGLTLRAVNILEKHSVITVREVVRLTYEDLQQMDNFGDKTVEELRGALVAAGVSPPGWKPVSSNGAGGVVGSWL